MPNWNSVVKKKFRTEIQAHPKKDGISYCKTKIYSQALVESASQIDIITYYSKAGWINPV